MKNDCVVFVRVGKGESWVERGREGGNFLILSPVPQILIVNERTAPEKPRGYPPESKYKCEKKIK